MISSFEWLDILLLWHPWFGQVSGIWTWVAVHAGGGAVVPNQSLEVLEFHYVSLEQ